jgi:hypothetical protein
MFLSIRTAAFISWFEEKFAVLVQLRRLVVIKLAGLCEMMPKYVAGINDSGLSAIIFLSFKVM